MSKSDFKEGVIYAIVASAALLAVGSVAQAQTQPQIRASVGCPPPGQVPLDWNAKQLDAACPPITPSSGPNPSNTTLNCENLKSRFMNRASVGNAPDVAVAQAQYNESCKPAPSGSTAVAVSIARPTIPDGTYNFSRGYTNPPRGSRGICDEIYTGLAYVLNGQIRFDSSSYRWTGTVSTDGYISIRQDGVSPIGNQQPLKNKTEILGPAKNASLENGYCGRGYFRLS